MIENLCLGHSHYFQSNTVQNDSHIMTALLEYLDLLSCVAGFENKFSESKFSCQAQLLFSVGICIGKHLVRVNLFTTLLSSWHVNISAFQLLLVSSNIDIAM